MKYQFPHEAHFQTLYKKVQIPQNFGRKHINFNVFNYYRHIEQ